MLWLDEKLYPPSSKKKNEMVVPFLIFKDVLVYLLIYLHSPGTLHALSLDSSPVFARRRRILATDNEKKYPDTSIILWNELPTAVLTYSTLEGFKDSLRQLSYIRHAGFNGIYHHDDGF